MFLIGYSGHAFVVVDILLNQGFKLKGYFENSKKEFNPFNLKYFGSEEDEKCLNLLFEYDYFIGIGDNNIRYKVQSYLIEKGVYPTINAIHPSSSISSSAELKYGIMVATNVSINPLVKIKNGVICNTGCIIEHECWIDNFAHIGPGAVLAGNVRVGERSFIGANSVVKQGITIGKNVTVGAGSVIILDIPDNVTVVGNPARIIKQSL